MGKKMFEQTSPMGNDPDVMQKTLPSRNSIKKARKTNECESTTKRVGDCDKIVTRASKRNGPQTGENRNDALPISSRSVNIQGMTDKVNANRFIFSMSFSQKIKSNECYGLGFLIGCKRNCTDIRERK